MEKINNWHWVDLQETKSTNDDAKKYPPNTIISAAKQTAGRGRLGRSWESMEGNLFVSFKLKVELKDTAKMVFIIGLSLLEAVKNISPNADVKIKWPNDILINNKKTAGILIERDDECLIIGIGVNIKQHPEDVNLIYQATSLKTEKINTDRVAFLKSCVSFLDKNLVEDFAKIKQKWLQNIKGLNQDIRISIGNSVRFGKLIGVADDGAIMLETQTGTEKIYAGDLSF